MSSMRQPEPARSRAWAVVFPVLAGLFAGVGSSALLARRAPAAPTMERPAAAAQTSREPPAAATAPAARPGVPPAMAARLEALENKVAEIDPSARVDAPAPPSREEARAEARRMHMDGIRRHTDAPLDPRWAPAAVASLSTAMRAMGESRGGQEEIKAVDCRTDSCVATIEFPSFLAAAQGHGDYVSSFYEVNCMRMATLDPPADETAPYTVSVLFQGCVKE